MRRRDFLLGGVKVSLSFLALDALGSPIFGQLAGAARRGRMPHDWINIASPPHLDDSLDVVAAYLVQYGPPEENFPVSGAWKATYDLIEWDGTTNVPGVKFSRRNRVIGHLVVTRRPGSAGTGVGYDLDYDITINAFKSTLKSIMHCSADRLPGLTDWQTDYEKHPLKGVGTTMKLREQGRVMHGMLEIVSGAGARRFQTDRPVAPQWCVLDALRGATVDPYDPVTEVEFDLLHDLTSYRPHQRLKPCGVLDISLDGKSHTLHGFIQTGLGTEPTHYWVDSKGRPLLVTGGLLSSAMISIQEV